jgi:hypothetical protein
LAGLPSAWWLALALLVLNDHLLKGSGLLPGWLTGKLSDFAGLIVAPILGCALIGPRNDRARTFVFVAVALAFAAIKLSVPCASAAGAALTAIGVPSRIWCDPTDLIAFSILPWAARLAGDLRAIEPRTGLLLQHRLALALASCACLATSDASYTVDGSAPFLINWTRAPLSIHAEKRFKSCDTDEPLSEPIEQSLVLQPAHGAAIGAFHGGYEVDAGDRRCGEATIRVGSATVRIAWTPERGDHNPLWFETGNHTASSFPVESDQRWIFDLGVTATGAVDSPVLQVGSALEPPP